MGSFQYEWWTVETKEATGRIMWEVKAKDKERAISQINRMADRHDKEVRTEKPNFKTEIFWDTLTLDHKGYQRLF